MIQSYVIAVLIIITAVTVGVANGWRRRAQDLSERLNAITEPCERPGFVPSLDYVSRAEMYDADPECLCTDQERAARLCKIQCPPHWRRAGQ